MGKRWLEGGGSPQHRLSAQRWADGINLRPNAVLAFNHPLDVHVHVLFFSLILINIVKKCF